MKITITAIVASLAGSSLLALNLAAFAVFSVGPLAF